MSQEVSEDASKKLRAEIEQAIQSLNWVRAETLARQLAHSSVGSPDEEGLMLLAVALLGQRRWRKAIAVYHLCLSLKANREQQIFRAMGNAGLKEEVEFFDYRFRQRLYFAVAAGALTLFLGLCVSFFELSDAVMGLAGLISLFLGGEAIYRIILFSRGGLPGERFAFPENNGSKGFLEVWNKQPKKFDAVRSYDLLPNDTFLRVVIGDDQVIEAGVAVSDENGNVGFTDRQCDPKCLNILVVGDSWTSFPGNGAIADDLEGVEWPYFLKKKFIESGFSNVRILNYARIGHGLQQMADVAAAVVEKITPDIVLFAFISDDVARHHYWHLTRNIGGVDRNFRVREPNPHASIEKGIDEYLVDDRITIEWVQQRVEHGNIDEVMADLLKFYRKLRRRSSHRAVDLFSTRRWYLCDLIFFGTPFIDVDEVPHRSLGRFLSISDFATLPTFVSAIEKIKASGARIAAFHLPTQEEIMRGKLVLRAKNERDLLDSFERLTGERVRWLLSKIKTSAADLALYPRAPHDPHPSAWAQELLASGAFEVFQEEPFKQMLQKAARTP